MNINRKNYELYIIDYLDGMLNSYEISEVLLFIEQNPDIKKELELLNESVVSITKEEKKFDTTFLKRATYSEIKNDFEKKLIANIEGELTYSEKIELEKAFIIYPELKVDAELFSKTKIIDDKNIVFENKNSLKKVVPIFQRYSPYIWRAAVLLAISGMWFLINNKPEKKFTAEQSTNISKTIPEKEFGTQQYQTKEKNTSLLSSVEKHSHKKKVEQVKTPPVETAKYTDAKIYHSEIIAQKELKMHNNTELSQLALPFALPSVTFTPIQKTIQPNQEDEYKNISQLALENFSADVLIEKNKPASAAKKISLTDVGLVFVKLYNKISGDHTKIVKKYDKTGEISGFEIVSNNFQFATGK